jgi:RNA polymerase sigma factor (sigma-70 family)
LVFPSILVCDGSVWKTRHALEAQTKPRVPWNQVWRLYFENQSTFWGVISSLRRRGISVSDEEATDLIHEFLMERAPFALATFHPERGQLESWLFVVFRRFAIGSYRNKQRMQTILEAWRDDISLDGVNEENEFTQDVQVVQAALKALPKEERKALRLFLEQDDGSMRAVARALRLSRWKATRLVVRSVARVAAALEVDIGLEPIDLHLLLGGGVHADASGTRTRSSGQRVTGTRRAIQRIYNVVALRLGISRTIQGEPHET